jgi:hypothetical protein
LSFRWYQGRYRASKPRQRPWRYGRGFYPRAADARPKLAALFAWLPSARNKYALATSAAHHESVVISKFANEIVKAEAKAA